MIALTSNTVYVGGDFTAVGAQSRTGLAALDAASSDVADWNPDPIGSLSTLVINGSKLYAGGGFTYTPRQLSGWDDRNTAYLVRLQGYLRPQTISGLLGALQVGYGTGTQSLTGIVSSGLAVNYSSAHASIASILGSTLGFIGVGITTVTASQMGNEDYAPANDIRIIVTVTQANLTVIADNFGRVYGSANPVFTGSILGVVHNDVILPSFITDATSLSGVGVYTIYATATGANIANYSLILTNATLTITKANLTVSAFNYTIALGEALPSFSGTVVGLVQGDVITPSFTSTALATSTVGTYPIFATASGIALANYQVAYQNGELTISATMGLEKAAASVEYLRMYPNPYTGTFTILNASESSLPYTIVDALGNTLADGTLPMGSHTLHTELARGVYFLHIQGMVTKLLIE